MALSAKAQKFVDDMAAYRSAMEAKGYTLHQTHEDRPEIYEAMANDGVSKPEDIFHVGREFLTNKGNRAGAKKAPGLAYVDPSAQYRIINERGKDKTLYTGTGLQGLDTVYEISQALGKEQGNKANWAVEQYNPTTGQWSQIANDDPSKNLLGKIADFALPVIGALAMPLTGGLSGALGAAVGAAGGSALSGVAQGRSIGDIIKNAAISGGLSYAGGSLLGGAGGGAGSGAASASGGLTSAATGAASGALGAIPGEIVVQGIKSGLGGAMGGALGAAGGAALGSGLGSGGEIVVQGTHPPTAGWDQSLVGGLSGAIGAGGLSPEVIKQIGQMTPEQQKQFGLDDVVKYLRAAGLITGLVGGAVGGGGGTQNGKVPGGLNGDLNPVFSASLPNPNIPGGVGNPANLGARTMPEQDWYTYAQRPEQSFFNYVPQTYIPGGMS